MMSLELQKREQMELMPASTHPKEQIDEEIDKLWSESLEQIMSIDAASENWKAQVLPLARIKKIMKSEDILNGTDKQEKGEKENDKPTLQQAAIDCTKLLGKLDASCNRIMIAGEAPVLLGKACELLVRDLTFRSWRHTERCRRRTLQKQDVQYAVGENEVYDYLIDIVPRLSSSMSSSSSADAQVKPPSKLPSFNDYDIQDQAAVERAANLALGFGNQNKAGDPHVTMNSPLIKNTIHASNNKEIQGGSNTMAGCSVDHAESRLAELKQFQEFLMAQTQQQQQMQQLQLQQQIQMQKHQNGTQSVPGTDNQNQSWQMHPNFILMHPSYQINWQPTPNVNMNNFMNSNINDSSQNCKK